MKGFILLLYVIGCLTFVFFRVPEQRLSESPDPMFAFNMMFLFLLAILTGLVLHQVLELVLPKRG